MSLRKWFSLTLINQYLNGLQHKYLDYFLLLQKTHPGWEIHFQLRRHLTTCECKTTRDSWQTSPPISHWNKNSVNYHLLNSRAVSFKDIEKSQNLQCSNLSHFSHNSSMWSWIFMVCSHKNKIQQSGCFVQRLEIASHHDSKLLPTFWPQKAAPFLIVIHTKWKITISIFSQETTFTFHYSANSSK